MMLGHVLEDSFVTETFALLVHIVKVKEIVTRINFVGMEFAEEKESVQESLDLEPNQFVQMDSNALKDYVNQKLFVSDKVIVLAIKNANKEFVFLTSRLNVQGNETVLLKKSA